MADQQQYAEQQQQVQQQQHQQQQQQQQQQAQQQAQQQQQQLQQQQQQVQQQQVQQQQVQQQQQQPQQQQAQAQQGQPNQETQQACIQQISNWDPSRGQLQVIPSLPNSGYLQYAPGQIIMPSANFAVQQPNGQIQLISSQPKQIQSGQIAATPHMFTAQGKQVITAPGTPASFSGFTAVPTSTNNPQTIFISNLPNIIPSQSVTAVATSKQQDLQKYNACGTTNRTVTQNAQQVQIPPQWQLQSMPPNMWATSSQPTFMTPTNAVYFRGGNQQEEYNQNVTTLQIVGTPNAIKRPNDQLQPKIAVTRSILPSSPTMRAGSSVSTQTATGVQMTQIMKAQKPRPKTNVVRTTNNMNQKAGVTQQIPQQVMPQPMIQQTAPIATQSPTQAQQQTMFQQLPPQLMIVQSPAQQTTPITTQPPTQTMFQQMPPQQTAPITTQPPAQTQQPMFQQLPPQLISAKPVSTPPVTTGAETTTAVVADDSVTQQPAQTMTFQQLPPQLMSTKPASTPPVTPGAESPAMVPHTPTSTESNAVDAPAPTESNAVVEEVKDKTLPRALVKPHVLTHVINGHIIQEADEPFPVYSSSQNVKTDEMSPAKKPKLENGVQNTTNEELQNGVAEMENGNSTAERVTLDPDLTKVNPGKWTVADVYKFIKALPGCSNYADEFENQEIDGQALMLLKEDHLMSAMDMKLGPALKIVAQIDSMREESPSQTN